MEELTFDVVLRGGSVEECKDVIEQHFERLRAKDSSFKIPKIIARLRADLRAEN